MMNFTKVTERSARVLETTLKFLDVTAAVLTLTVSAVAFASENYPATLQHFTHKVHLAAAVVFGINLTLRIMVRPGALEKNKRERKDETDV
jgi:hypothetical protein